MGRRPSRLRGCGLLTVAIVLGIVSPAAAGLSTAGRVPISDMLGKLETATSVADDGTALVAYSTSPPAGSPYLEVRLITPDGTVSPPRRLYESTLTAFQPQIATANGRWLVLWRQANAANAGGALIGRWIEHDGTPGPLITIAATATNQTSYDPAATGTNDGGAVVAWHRLSGVSSQNRSVQAVKVSAAGAVSAIADSGSGREAYNVNLAPTTTGGALLAWNQSSGVTGATDAVQRLKSDGTFAAVQPLTGAGLTPAPRLAVDDSDHFRTPIADSLGTSLSFRALSPDGFAVGGDSPFSDPGFGPISSTAIASNADDRSVVAWNRIVGGKLTVRVRFIGQNSVLDSDTFSAPDATAAQSGERVAIDGSGAAALAYTSTPTTGKVAAVARLFPASGAPSAPTPVSDPARGATSPDVRLAPNGVGVVTWMEDDGGSTAQVVARQILPPPSCTDGSATVTQGRPVAITLACAGLQLLAPTIATQPRHGSLTVPDGAGRVTYTPTPGFDGTDSFTFTGHGRGGDAVRRTVTIRVGRDTVAPLVTRLRVTPRRVRLGRSGRIAVASNEAATARVSIERLRACTRAAKRKGCKPKYVRFGRVSATTARATTATFRFRRTLAKARLRSGSFRATVVLTDAAGNRSKAKRARFTIAPAKRG